MQLSRIYNFIDSKTGFSVHFFEGAQLLSELTRMHELNENAQKYYTESILSAQHLIHFLKPGENLGFYVDNEEPLFRFKIEMSEGGKMRTLLLPGAFKEFPELLNGKCRLVKTYPNKRPYTSFVEMNDLATHELPNIVLSDSYQTNAKINLSVESKRSVMVVKLPPINVDQEQVHDLSLKDYIEELTPSVHEIFQQKDLDIEKIVQTFEALGLAYLSSKQIAFHCSCSRENMVENLKRLHHEDIEEVFQNDAAIDITCDYCLTNYHIEKSECHPKQ